MPSTIVWFAVAVMAGAVVGMAFGHWSTVAAWLARCLEDPVVPDAGERDKRRPRDLKRTS